ncbi:MAG: GNAT family N-acetyltransferase [Halothiobacillaceae bacterium]|nr:GNAT family N-acetyltransferase [Halothiobacillaceae bacterium]
MIITTKVFNSIDEVEPVVWDGLLGLRSLTFSHAFWQVVEQSNLNDFAYRYVIFFDADDQPIGLTTCYVVTTDIAIFAPLWLRTILVKARRFYSNFLKLKMLECGTPIILNSPPFVIHPDVEVDDLIEPLHKTLKRQARKDGVLLMVLRDFESSDLGLFEPLNTLGYHEVMGLPNTYLDIRWPSIEAYRADLKSYYRSKVNNHLRKNAELDVHHDLLDDFAHLSDDLCAQWMNVHERAHEFQREVLTPTFYRELSQQLHPHAKILRFFKGERWVGHALLLHDRDEVRWLYFGRAEPVNDSLYLYVVQTVIQTTIELGAKRLEMGLTTYPIKQDAGARLEPIRFAIRSPNDLINPIVGRVYALLNKLPPLRDKQVFKSQGQDATAHEADEP